jgi:hypothetical protein
VAVYVTHRAPRAAGFGWCHSAWPNIEYLGSGWGAKKIALYKCSSVLGIGLMMASNWPKHAADLLDSRVVLGLKKNMQVSCKFHLGVGGEFVENIQM